MPKLTKRSVEGIQPADKDLCSGIALSLASAYGSGLRGDGCTLSNMSESCLCTHRAVPADGQSGRARSGIRFPVSRGLKACIQHFYAFEILRSLLVRATSPSTNGALYHLFIDLDGLLRIGFLGGARHLCLVISPPCLAHPRQQSQSP